MNGHAHVSNGQLDRKSKVTETFQEYRSTLDGMNERRERLIISSRQITSLSKKLIFHLHRISLFPKSTESNSTERSKILDEAEEKIDEIRACVKSVGDDLKGGDVGYWAYARNISGGIQEYIEAISFLHYLRYHSLITLDQVRDTLRDPSGAEPFEIVSEDYALGISDLSGELMRYATNCSSTGDYAAALQACSFVRDLKSGLDSAQPFVRDLGKKQSITEQSLLKIEKICYAIQLRVMEYGDRPEILAEMAKRAMADSNDDFGAEGREDQAGGESSSAGVGGADRAGGGRGRGRGRGGRGGSVGGRGGAKPGESRNGGPELTIANGAVGVEKDAKVALETTEKKAKVVVDYEIPRKAMHSSIGLLALFLYHLNPPSVRPLMTALCTFFAIVVSADMIRLQSPAFNGFYIKCLGPLMRTSEITKWNGVIPYLFGIIFVLAFYPREIMLISVLTLSWVDTIASVVGRWVGPRSPPLPATVPLIPFIPLAPRKSLAGYLAAAITGFLIAVGFWWNAPHLGKVDARDWAMLSSSSSLTGATGLRGEFLGKPVGLWVTGLMTGLFGATVEAWDTTWDDNITLPILTGALVWGWLTMGSYFTAV